MIFDAGNPEALSAAIQTAAPGDIIELTGGRWAEPVFIVSPQTSGLTINNVSALLPGLRVVGANGFTFLNLHGVYTFDNERHNFGRFHFDLCNDLTVANGKFQGSLGSGKVTPTSTVTNVPWGRGLSFADCANLLVEENTIDLFRFGITLGNCTNATVRKNVILNRGIDGIQIVGGKIINIFQNFIGAAYADVKRTFHGDGIHNWAYRAPNGSLQITQELTIEENLIDARGFGSGMMIQTGDIDGDGAKDPMFDLTILRNLIAGAGVGIQCDQVIDADISENEILQIGDPRFYIGISVRGRTQQSEALGLPYDGSKNVSLLGNRYYGPLARPGFISEEARAHNVIESETVNLDELPLIFTPDNSDMRTWSWAKTEIPLAPWLRGPEPEPEPEPEPIPPNLEPRVAALEIALAELKTQFSAQTATNAHLRAAIAALLTKD